MKRMSLAGCLCFICLGCGEALVVTEDEPTPAPVKRPSIDLAIMEKALEDPLTEHEVLGFIELVKSLPGGQPPTFHPVSAGAKVQGLHLDAAIEAWRGAVRDALTVDTLMKGWSPQTAVRQALIENQIPSRALTSLMLRLSCSIGAEAMGGTRNVVAQRVIADEKVGEIIARIQQLNRSGQPVPDAYWQSLEEATSLAEYLAVLSAVPEENQHLVTEHKEALLTILPMPTKLTEPRETREDDHIVPVRFEEPASEKPRPSSLRLGSKKR